ncbi:hypothetical protein [Nostoc sp.]|uniref:hypothetical protein n=1 Tax=Nostoc sp. TaxID=1180 RepID=UPI002FF4CC47
MKLLRGAETIAKKTPKEIKKDWKYIKGGQAFVRTFIKAKFPEDWDDLQAGRTTLDEYVDLFQKDEEALAELKEFAEVFSTSYAPLFSFRSNLFESLSIRDPHGFILDESEETKLDPFHLLRYYEFIQNGDYIEVTSRAAENYELSFRLRYNDNWQEFISTELNKLTAFKNCQIIRSAGGAIRPTPLIQALNKYLLPGVIICPRTNAAVIFQLNKQGIISYPITIVWNDMEKEYRLFSGLSGILTMAMKFKQLRLPDDEVFIV